MLLLHQTVYKCQQEILYLTQLSNTLTFLMDSTISRMAWTFGSSCATRTISSSSSLSVCVSVHVNSLGRKIVIKSLTPEKYANSGQTGVINLVLCLALSNANKITVWFNASLVSFQFSKFRFIFYDSLHKFGAAAWQMRILFDLHMWAWFWLNMYVWIEPPSFKHHRQWFIIYTEGKI